jgi:cytochrome c
MTLRKLTVGGTLVLTLAFAAGSPPENAASAQAKASAPPAAYARCAVCHTADKGGMDKLGPNLFGVVGSSAGQGKFAFSDELKRSGLKWNEATLHKWLENPKALVPGNRMSFPGIKDAAKRQEIIDYLKKQK